MGLACRWRAPSGGGARVEGGGEWKRRWINSVEIDGEAKEACLEALRSEIRLICCPRPCLRWIWLFYWKYARWRAGGVGRGGKPPPGFSFSLSFFFSRWRTFARHWCGKVSSWSEAVILCRQSAFWCSRLLSCVLDCRPQSPSDDQPDKIVFFSKKNVTVQEASPPFLVTCSHSLAKLVTWPSNDLETRIFSSPSSTDVLYKTEIMLMLIRLFY